MFTGSYVALVTPMTEARALDWGALDALVDWHLEAGTHGFVPVGTTGESPTLDIPDHLKVIERVIQRVAGRRPVLAGTGSNATDEAILMTREAHAVLQQAYAGRALSAFFGHCGCGPPAGGAVQRAGSHGGGSAARDGGTPCGPPPDCGA